MRHRFFRITTQAAVLCLMFVVPLLNVFEIYCVTGTFYAINFGRLSVSDPSVILQAIFAVGESSIPLLTAAMVPIFLSLLFGRIWCGWMCPYHLLADGAWALRQLFRERFCHGAQPELLVAKQTFNANLVRFAFLVGGTMIAGVIGIPVLNYVNAPGIMSTEAMILIKDRLVSIEFWFIVVLFSIELLFFPRFWCRLFCPTGSVISLFRTPFTMKVGTGGKTPGSPCCKENHCSRACPMGLEPYKEGHNLLCTNCARCIDACAIHRLAFRGFESQ
jgi:ferredoxin-type protein NapH